MHAGSAWAASKMLGLTADAAPVIIIIDNRGLNARWCLTPLLLSLSTAAHLGQRGLTPAGLPHTTAQCHLTPGSLSFCCRSFCRYGRRGAIFSVSLSAVTPTLPPLYSQFLDSPLVTRVDHSKTMHVRITKSLPSAAWKTLWEP